jgi:hypothetical protein
MEIGSGHSKAQVQHNIKRPSARYDGLEKDYALDSPASLVGEAVAQTPHMIANGSPFGAADHADILNIQNSEE